LAESNRPQRGSRSGRLDIDKTGAPFWWDAAPPQETDGQSLPKTADVVIIGAGYTGLGAALTLARGGREVVVLDANAPGTGASTRNLGFFGSELRVSLGTLLKRYGENTAVALTQTAHDGFEHSKSMIEAEQIRCDLQDLGRLNCAARPAHFDALAREAELLNRSHGIECQVLSKPELEQQIGTTAYYGGYLQPSAFSVHPGKWYQGLLDRARSAGARIIGNTLVTGLDRSQKRIQTERGTITARDILVATNAYTSDFIPELKRRVVPTGASIIVTESLPEELMRAVLHKPRLCIDTFRIYRAFRPSPDGDRIMLAGRSNDPSKGPEHNGEILRRKLVSIFPVLADTRISYSWGGYVGFTFDFLPHLGDVNGIHYAMGMNGAGVTMAPYLGHQIACKMLGRTDQEFLLDRFEFQQRRLYGGDPWFMPLLLSYFRMLDRLGV